MLFPGLNQGELLSLAQTLDMGVTTEELADLSAIDEASGRIASLEARANRARLLMIVGGVLVIVGATLAAVGSPVLGAVALIGMCVFVAGMATRKNGDLVSARNEHSRLTIQVAAKRESASRFTQARFDAEARCTALGVPADPAHLRALATEVSRAETFAERSRDFAERVQNLRTARDTALISLRSALLGRSEPVDDEPEHAYARYIEACEERENLAEMAAERPALEEQLAQRARAEETLANQVSAQGAAERQVSQALAACGLSAATPQEAVAGLEAWEERRQSDLEAVDVARSECPSSNPC